jgi:hypothetical protein
MNAHNIAKKPLQHIDMMAGLIGERAAIRGSHAAQGIAIVVAPIPAPAHTHSTANKTAEPANLQRRTCAAANQSDLGFSGRP